ncbi:hypothetical protein HNP84_000885 [Thermocatellispora tengchongensis]|uniref:Fibronectin type-III domain-containing protein n=1 Tax=Thermocatellispora tengchongensis TaxID=1073253 RepID=A0A840NWJ3_9ACTN|nr:hypothetical protein [Thermocatellispora tengchongensis]MBB5131179.1 hypothetical protein [Thermocatellispora tengchongensis]
MPRPRGDRATALIATAVVGALVAVAAVFGVGISSANPALADVGAWLWSTGRGSVVHANGLSGEVDGRIDVRGKAGTSLKVVQDGATVLLVDERTGVVSRIEPSRLEVTQTRDFATAGLQFVVSGKVAYAVDPEGTVQRIDPATLNAIGTPLSLPRPLGAAGIDGGGGLWVPVSADGTVVRVRDGVQEKAVRVGKAGDPLALTIAGGLPVVTNSRTSQATVIGEDGSTGVIELPEEVRIAGDEPVLSPLTTEGPLAPILVPGADGLVVVIDTDQRAPQSVKLSSVADPDALGVPEVLGTKVYIPDSRTGGLIVWDSATGGEPTEIPVRRGPGELDVFVKDGQLWANDPHGDQAVVIDVEGRRHGIDKDDRDVPGPSRTPKPLPTPKTRPTGAPDPQDTRPPEPDPTTPVEEAEPDPAPTKTHRKNTPPPRPTPTPTPTPSATPSAPQPPGTVSAKSGPGKIDVMFSPSTGGKVDHYTLTVSPSGGTLTPERVDAEGPFQFEFRGGDCGTDYTFTVVAHWAGGEVASEPSAGAKPCVAPGAPTGFQAKAKNQGADLTWNAPENAGDGTTYTLSGAVSKDGISGTSYSVTGLKNNQKHEFTLKARNAAGEGEGTATTTVDLAYPRGTYKNANNNQVDTLIRSGPSKTGEIGRIPKGQYISITVICQVKGASVTESETGETSDVWNRIEWNGGVGYLSETLMTTPRGGFPAAPLFQCDD